MSEPTRRMLGAPRTTARRRLLAVAWITLLVALGEAVAGILTGSLALFTDAFHAFTHAIAAGIGYGAAILASSPASPERTYRNWRIEILAALVNGLLMLPLVGYILYETWRRLTSPGHIDAAPMLAVAAVGLAANLLCAAILKKRSREDLNVRSTFLHMLADAVTSAAVLVAGVAILLGASPMIDPMVAVLISLFILRWAVGMIREAGQILLEAAPRHIRPEDIRCELLSTEGVRDVHDLHIWTITSRMHALTVHIVLDRDLPVSQSDAIARRLAARLRGLYDINHSTFQFEVAAEACEPAHVPGTGPIPQPPEHNHLH